MMRKHGLSFPDTLIACAILAWGMSLAGCHRGADDSSQGSETSFVIHQGESQQELITPDMINFQDQVRSGPLPTIDLLDLRFQTLEHQTVQLRSLIQPGRKLVVIVTRGYAGEICKFCSTFVSNLVANYSKFTDRETDLVVIYPVQSDQDAPRLMELQMAVAAQLRVPNLQIPFPMLLDVNLEAVKQLEIQKNLAKPATYIFDENGLARFAYVGNHLADRPSVQALLDEIDKIR